MVLTLLPSLVDLISKIEYFEIFENSLDSYVPLLRHLLSQKIYLTIVAPLTRNNVAIIVAMVVVPPAADKDVLMVTGIFLHEYNGRSVR